VCLCVSVLKADNQNLGFTYGMDMTLMGGEVTYIRNRLETGGFNATEYRGKRTIRHMFERKKDLNTINQKCVD